MNDQSFDALRAAIAIARDQNIRCLSTLKRILIQSGFAEQHITEAIAMWRSYEDVKRYGSRSTPGD